MYDIEQINKKSFSFEGSSPGPGFGGVRWGVGVVNGMYAGGLWGGI